MLIYVMRHGETVANRDQRMQGWYQSPLTENGIALAQKTGEEFKAAGVAFDYAVTSPLQRSYDTCRYVLRGCGCGSIPVKVDKRVKEVYCGPWEGQKKPTVSSKTLINPAEFAAYEKDPFEAGGFRYGERIADVMERTYTFLTELAAEEHECVLVSTHGFLIRCMLNFLYEDRADFWQGGLIPNCSVSVIEAKNGEMKLIQKDKIYY